MATTHSVVEVLLHITEKLTSSTGEHFIGGPSTKDLFENVTQRSLFTRGEPSDEIYEEHEQVSTGSTSGSSKRTEMALPCYKTFLESSIVVLSVIVLVGTLCGAIGLATIYVLLNTGYHCDWVNISDPSLTPTNKVVIVVGDLLTVILIDHWLLSIWITVFKWKAIKKSHVLFINTMFMLTDVCVRCVFRMLNLYSGPSTVMPYLSNALYVLVLLASSYFLGKILFPKSKKATVKVALMLSLPILALATTTYSFIYVVFPYFVSIHGISKLLVATIAPLFFVPTKLFSRFCLLRLQGIIHHGYAFALMSVVYAVFAALSRAMQANLPSLQMFVIFGVLRGIIHVSETFAIAMFGKWLIKLRLFCCRQETNEVIKIISFISVD